MDTSRRPWAFLPITPDSPLFAICRRYAWTAPVVAAVEFVAGALEIFSIGLLLPLLDMLAGNESAAESSFTSLLMTVPRLFPEGYQLIGVCLVILIGLTVKGLLNTANSTFIAWIEGRVSHDMRVALADRLLHVGYPFMLQHGGVRSLNILNTESWRATEAIQRILRMISSAAAITVFFVLLLIIQWQLCIIAVLGALIIRGVQMMTRGPIDAVGREVQLANLLLNERMVQIAMTSAKVIRLFGREDYEAKKYEDRSDKVRKRMLTAAAMTGAVGPAIEVMFAATFLLVFLLAQQLGIGISVLVIFLAIVYRLQPHIRQVTTAAAELSRYSASLREVEWLLGQRDVIPLPSGTKPFPGLKREIRFDGVAFDYPGKAEEPVLKRANFSIAADAATALVGRSGSGKSTIVNLLARLIEPTAGQILIDGLPLREIDIAEFRRNLAIAGQDVDLFDGTVRENIAYSRPDATDTEIEQAARDADAHDFISSLPNGYSTVLAGTGLSLSGGQRQRIGLARALLRKPAILVLDEATSAIDSLSEQGIMNVVLRRPPGQTLIVISHRQSTLENCDYGMTIVEGRIQNSPADLSEAL